MKSSVLLVCVSLFWPVLLVAQVTPLYPDVPSSYNFNRPIISPAFIPGEGKYIMGGIYKFEPGEPNIAVFDVNAAAVLGQKDNKHLVRVALSNEKEGPYIKTPRGTFNYAYQLSLSNDLKFSTGVSLGYVSRVYTAPSATGVGNVTLPDGHLGIEVKYRNTRIGSSLMQFLNSEGEALQSQIRLNSFYSFYATSIQELNETWSLKEHALLRILPEVTTQVIGGVSFLYMDMLELGTVYYQRRGVAFQLVIGVNEITNPLKISILYNSALLSKSPLWVNSMELGLIYTLRK